MRAGLARYLSPPMRQEFFEPLDGMFRDAAKHISEPGKRLDLDEFTGRNEAAQHSRSLAPVVAAEEGPVIASHRETPQRPLRGIVVNRQIAVGAVPGQRRPVLQCVGNSLP